MKRTYLLPVLCMLLASGGCASRSTDPRQGGLFGYNPQAYEQRLRERRQHLERVERENKSMEAEDKSLETERAARGRELASLKRQLATLSSQTAALRQQVASIRTTTTAHKREQQRILKELAELQSAVRASDDVADPEEQRLELERLQKKRDRLLQEANELMQL